MKNIAILVLAAGKSSRMKSIKQLEKINNTPLIEITLEKIQAIFTDHIFCVLGANAAIVKQGITTKNIQFINNKNFENGLSSSIVAGIDYFREHQLNFDSIFILLADQPAIEVSYLAHMVDLSSMHQGKIIASNYGNKLGVPALFPAIYHSELLLIKGDKGAKEFINLKRKDVVCPTVFTNLTDIDTKEDLNSYIKSISKNNLTT
ncbi:MULTISPECIES: nucleotidyltransferase family protein [unclassified Polaribacter]|uniref:nucleotidyltransferase family protein n=1 Tax=unclassified Polaribacter TaxID=196858 RepID=UPI0011BF8F18|nr:MULTISPECIES: nucleotidyltransferase family protein [unclassified Polaribacter]TXD52679.1 nucleotidyltransferase family protein [Polaribacter sp. IC063]TXD60647.1 nucleotidyltransferase family protein [Polaribacter sp. IC066]